MQQVVSLEYLWLIHGSMILDNIWTQFLGGGDLYVGATYRRVYTVTVAVFYEHFQPACIFVHWTVFLTYTNKIHFVYTESLVPWRPTISVVDSPCSKCLEVAVQCMFNFSRLPKVLPNERSIKIPKSVPHWGSPIHFWLMKFLYTHQSKSENVSTDSKLLNPKQ